MRAVFEQVKSDPLKAMLVRHIEMPTFDAPFHFHPEYELTLIIKGSGQRYVGKQVDSFQAEDLVFLGSNLPHCWINQKKEISENIAEAIVVQFNPDFLGKDFFTIPEFSGIRAFLEKSRAGLEIHGSEKTGIISGLFEMLQAAPTRRILILLDILHTLSHAVSLKPIDILFGDHPFKFSETNRFHKVFSYLIAHYTEDISLEKISKIAGLSPTSFCRYFKNVTRQSFKDVLLEFRMKQSCHLLFTTDLTIKEIAFRSGFYDIPYFNRIFKNKKGMSPNQYKKAVRSLPDKYITHNNDLPV
jgi:AraC-like DNA-binding protein